MTWDAARAASKRPLPKPTKTHAPVGEKRDPSYPHHVAKTTFDIDDMRVDEGACDGCGHHICSCARVAYSGLEAVLKDTTVLFPPVVVERVKTFILTGIWPETLAMWTAPQTDPPSGGTLTREKIMTYAEARKDD